MNEVNRTTRFEGRVELERDFLTRVNNAFGQTIPLAGMTRAAIESWATRANGSISDAKIESIKRILIEASTRAELLADNSRDVFEPMRRPKPGSLDQLHILLDEALQS